MNHQLISITDNVSIENGAHILYFYESMEGYIENATTFILTSIKQGQHVIFVDSEDRYRLVMSKIESLLSGEMKEHIHYLNNEQFYRTYDHFDFQKVLHNLNEVIDPYLDKDVPIRLWGHVDWMDQEKVIQKLHTYEHECDLTISELGFITVCAYNGMDVPAAIQTKLMKSHKYLMTDTELVHSSLYSKSSDEPTVFPSISVQSQLESEMDLYKQKLDFVHVVSHEVRNPLTVIKSYASLLSYDETNENKRQKLQTIIDYAEVIDNEMTHIISTEQMLTSESLWKRHLIFPCELLEEVIHIMETKSRTQNIQLSAKLCLDKKVKLLSNKIGFKLIVSNILSNAIKYSNEGQRVTFEACQEEGILVMRIKDEGIGMSSDQLNRLFNKYEKLNEERSGQGVGLFMVKKLLDHFDGDIEVQSVINKGTTVTVKLPVQSRRSVQQMNAR